MSRTMLVATLCYLFALAGALSSCAPAMDAVVPSPAMEERTAGPSQQTGGDSSAATIADSWGVRIESLRFAGEGNMIDFRFRVLDADKAAPLLERANKPLLTDEKRGITAAVPTSPKLGPMRQTTRNDKPREGRVYFVMFSNPGKLIQKDDPVTIVIGDFKVEHQTVQ